MSFYNSFDYKHLLVDCKDNAILNGTKIDNDSIKSIVIWNTCGAVCKITYFSYQLF